IFKNEALAYLLKYDTIMGTLKQDVTHDDHALYVGGKKILMTSVKNPAEAKWKELGIDVVIESTGIFTARADLEKHLAAGAKRVLLTVPPKDNVDHMVVIGVNDDQLMPEHRLVSNASCTTNCLAPLAKVLDDSFGIKHGIMTTVHAYTNDQRLADVPHEDFRRSRAAAENIIPTTTGAARAVGVVLPKLMGKLDGIAARVPVSDGSVVDLVVELEKHPDKETINEAVRRCAEGPLKNVLEYSEVPLVSSDIIGNPHSSIFDSLVTQSKGDGYARVVSWYDNEWGYSNRCVNVIERLGQFD
ncbi:MAG TPA: type I glyceraldehyde-3-phosphate dehydrogenase, partial [Candidatus Binatia bacterium]|nr:type I glyceraldehyde-3-phosphate dehydrogenase [Candidatus Binatia bacterium]